MKTIEITKEHIRCGKRGEYQNPIVNALNDAETDNNTAWITSDGNLYRVLPGYCMSEELQRIFESYMDDYPFEERVVIVLNDEKMEASVEGEKDE